MFKTANPSVQQKPLFACSLVILAICLVFHFLVEDTVLYSTAESLAQENSANPIPGDEAEHQDDLVLLADLPDYLPNNEIPAAFPLADQGERQTNFPIITPPKIA